MKPIKRQKKHAALLICVIVSALLCTLWSLFMKPSLYAEYTVDYKTPSLVLMLHGIRDGVYPWDAFEGEKNLVSERLADISSDITEKFGKPDDEKVPTSEPAPVETSEIPSELPSEIEPEVIPEYKPREFTTVDDNYFTDALFIGDSRMAGLSEYCEPLYSRADFYVKRSMTIYQLLEGKEIKFGEEKKTLWEVLDEKQYGKIYIQVGINEIGTGNPEYFLRAYSQVISQISERQPDALIFVNSIMHVTNKKSKSDKLYNNANINERNAVLETLADNYQVFYIDINENIDDENGGMKQEYSYDEIHLLGSCYEPFHRSLLSHGIIKE